MIEERKLALIYGVTGQDGSYLSELLLEKDYMVVGVIRRTSTTNDYRIRHLKNNPRFELVEGDITDSGSVFSIVQTYSPDEIYNLAAQSHVGTSFEQPYYTFQVDTIGELNILEAIRQIYPPARHYFAGTSEQFGNNYSVDHYGRRYQDEKTPFAPTSPYAVAKVAAHNLVKLYRESYNIHASVGILFNHASPRRGDLFVTKKITNWLNDFRMWLEANHHFDWTEGLEFDGDYIVSFVTGEKYPKLRLGNIDASRDWGYAGDYVKAMYLMIQQDNPSDYVIATGETYTVRDFLTEAFKYVDIDNYEPYVVIDPKFYRPSDVQYLCGRPTKAMLELGWFCEVSFPELVCRMLTEGKSYEKETTTELAAKNI